MGYEIGSRIAQYRKKKKYSQKEFSGLIGVSNSRVSNWEQGTHRPDVDILAKICRVLEVSPSELLDIRLSTDELTEHERRLILAYREKRELQSAIDVLLDIKNKC